MWWDTLPETASQSLRCMCDSIPMSQFTDNSSRGDVGFEKEPSHEILKRERRKFIWQLISPTFAKACPVPLREAVEPLNMQGVRVSVNLINQGLPLHKDMVIPNQPDPNKCVPGLSISVHLGAPKDLVYLGFSHKPEFTELKSGMLAIFPGYLLKHKTVRPIPKPQPAPKRYSLVLFIKFKDERADEMDKYLRESFKHKLS